MHTEFKWLNLLFIDLCSGLHFESFCSNRHLPRRDIKNDIEHQNISITYFGIFNPTKDLYSPCKMYIDHVNRFLSTAL